MTVDEATQLLTEMFPKMTWRAGDGGLEPWGAALVQTYLDGVPHVTWERGEFPSPPGSPYMLRVSVRGQVRWLLDVLPATGQFEWWDATRSRDLPPDEVSKELLRLRFPHCLITGDERTTVIETPSGKRAVVEDLRTEEQRRAPSWPAKGG
jgi:hypothetical protein